MAHVEIYTTQVCPYCVRAKDLLRRKGVTPVELRVDIDNDLRDQMLERANGRRTVPQIFIDNVHVGGCDDLYALESAGKLDGMLDV
ncbi:MAG: glutaredoxin 3 [Micavibrio aeruginosavorus]|uniref:Glutaredoxin n=1 Tax=Micavibrio aeruginosavorus TaxID=349221 RepID=A0A7T5R1K9_9BACT|nr:MAG: glutaredoxin 3 [Micavibrio aeruginosavorus]